MRCDVWLLIVLSLEYVYAQDLYGVKQCDSLDNKKYANCRMDCAKKYNIDIENACNMLFCSYCMDAAIMLKHETCCNAAKESAFLTQLFTIVCTDVKLFWNCKDPSTAKIYRHLLYTLLLLFYFVYVVLFYVLYCYRGGVRRYMHSNCINTNKYIPVFYAVVCLSFLSCIVLLSVYLETMRPTGVDQVLPMRVYW